MSSNDVRSTETGAKDAQGLKTPADAQNGVQATTAPSAPTTPPKQTMQTQGGKRVAVHSYDFVGPMRPDGQPERHLGSHQLPPRLLTREEYMATTPEQRKALKSHPDLYQPVSERAYANRVKRDEDAAADREELPIEYRIDPVYLPAQADAPDAPDDDDADDLVDDDD
jgi:hypothetical protein